jgi:serine/threonine-protein kinase
MKPGDSLDGRYTITDRLGAGGMGEVYKATHTFLGSSRVVKVIHPHISGNTDARDRFLREARAATKVQHQNVATLHDFASLPDGAHYMVWEFIDGENLAQRLRVRGTLPPRQAVRIALQALRGLDAIHRAGIIHRDISPENLMITADDEVKIIDLGVAKVEETDAVSQTRTGIFVGKLRYAAPEQLGFIPEGEKVDARADLYSMAMVLVELLTGRPPYEAKSPHEYFMLHAVEPRKQTVSIPPDLPGSAALQAVLEKALSRDRNQRYANAREFAAALEEIERSLPEPRDMPTMALPIDGDATMRVMPKTNADTLHRDTLRESAAASTIRTPFPEGVVAASETIRTPLPAPIEAPAVPPPPVPAVAQSVPPTTKMRAGLNPVYAVAFIALLVLAIGALLLWPREKRRDAIVQLPQTSTQKETSPPQPPQIAEASVTVTSAPTETATQLAATNTSTSVLTTSAPIASPVSTSVPAPATATTAPPQPTPPLAATTTTAAPKPPKRTPPRQKESEPVRETAAPPPVVARNVPTYRDGDDEGDNDRALEILRRELRGVRRVAIRPGGGALLVVRALRDEAPSLQVDESADVVIQFEGRNERLGAGRKRRSAIATVEKNGRVIFRYELPEEVYRVGNTGAEAFASVFAEAVEE